MKIVFYLFIAVVLISCKENQNEDSKKEKQELGEIKKTEDIPRCDCKDLILDSTSNINSLNGEPYTGICLTNYPDDSSKVMEEIQYLDGKIHGYYRIYSKEKVILTEDQYVEGIKQRLDKNFNCDCDELKIEELGNDKIRTYLLNGQKFTGVCEKYTKDGKTKILDMQFKDGLRHGNSLYYDQYGDPITSDVYAEGKFVKTVVYTKD